METLSPSSVHYTIPLDLTTLRPYSGLTEEEYYRSEAIPGTTFSLKAALVPTVPFFPDHQNVSPTYPSTITPSVTYKAHSNNSVANTVDLPSHNPVLSSQSLWDRLKHQGEPSFHGYFSSSLLIHFLNHALSAVF